MRYYDYPRYYFTDKSRDILAICGRTLDTLGIAWKYARWDNIAVSRRDAVATLDEFVGPKC